MQIPTKIQKWINKCIVPHRILLSGPGDNFALALQIAAKLQGTSTTQIKTGLQPDTLVFADTGKSFKTKYSEQAKKDQQSEQENAAGLIEWAHKKPVAPYRIIILENLERANREATNKLLKLIEEPPHKTIFIFTTRNHFRLLDTMISRMTVVSVFSETQNTNDVSDAENFLIGKNLIKKFRFIEALDKETKNNPQKKINRQVVLDFLQLCLEVARKNVALQKHLELIYNTYRGIEMNLNIKCTLERMVMQLMKK